MSAFLVSAALAAALYGLAPDVPVPEPRLVIAEAERPPRKTGPSFTVLKPETWPGNAFPLLEHVEGNLRARLERGRWLILLYHHDCPSCAEEIPKYEQWAAAHRPKSGWPEVALLEMEPYAPESWLAGTPSCRHARLSGKTTWVVIGADRRTRP